MNTPKSMQLYETCEIFICACSHQQAQLPNKGCSSKSVLKLYSISAQGMTDCIIFISKMGIISLKQHRGNIGDYT